MKKQLISAIFLCFFTICQAQTQEYSFVEVDGQWAVQKTPTKQYGSLTSSKSHKFDPKPSPNAVGGVITTIIPEL